MVELCGASFSYGVLGQDWENMAVFYRSIIVHCLHITTVCLAVDVAYEFMVIDKH